MSFDLTKIDVSVREYSKTLTLNVPLQEVNMVACFRIEPNLETYSTLCFVTEFLELSTFDILYVWCCHELIIRVQVIYLFIYFMQNKYRQTGPQMATWELKPAAHVKKRAEQNSSRGS